MVNKYIRFLAENPALGKRLLEDCTARLEEQERQRQEILAEKDSILEEAIKSRDINLIGNALRRLNPTWNEYTIIQEAQRLLKEERVKGKDLSEVKPDTRFAQNIPQSAVSLLRKLRETKAYAEQTAHTTETRLESARMVQECYAARSATPNDELYHTSNTFLEMLAAAKRVLPTKEGCLLKEVIDTSEEAIAKMSENVRSIQDYMRQWIGQKREK